MRLGSYLLSNDGRGPEQSKFQSYAQKYVWTPLASISLGSTDPYHIYGVVIDATAPYIKNKPCCNVRIIDQSLNLRAANDSKQTFLTLLIFANDQNHLPLVLRTGDIIRVTRCTVTSWKGSKQLNSNVWNKSSWAVFRGYHEQETQDELIQKDTKTMEIIQADSLLKNHNQLNTLSSNEYQPITVSQYKYSFQAQSEEPIVRQLREWSREYFSQFQAYSLYTILPTQAITVGDTVRLPEQQDFDILGRVITIERLDDINSVVLFRDFSGQKFRFRFNHWKFDHVMQNSVLRFRSVKMAPQDNEQVDPNSIIKEQQDQNVKGTIELTSSAHTNIMHVPTFMKSAKMVTERASIVDEEVQKLLLNSPVSPIESILTKPRIVSKLGSLQFNEKDRVFLREIDSQPVSADLQQSSIFKIKTSIIGFGPQNIREFCQAYCQTNKTTHSWADVDGSQTSTLTSVFNVVFWCKDEDSESEESVFQIHYCTPITNTDSQSNQQNLSEADKKQREDALSKKNQRQDCQFFNLEPCNLYQCEDNYQKIVKSMHLCLQYNVHVEMLVEVQYCEQLAKNVYILLESQLVDLD